MQSIFYCELHPKCQLQAVSFQEKQTRKSRLFCAKCMIECLHKQDKVEQLVYIEDLINDPTEAILKATKPESQQNIDENDVLSQIEKLLIKLENSIKSQLVIIRQNLQQMRLQVSSITAELCNNLKLNDLAKQFELVKSMDRYQGSNELAQLEEKLKQISANLMKTYVSAKEKVRDNLQLIVNNYYDNFKLIANEVDLTSHISLELFYKVESLVIPKILFDDIFQFPQIHYQISEGRLIQYQLLYQGTRDGLNFDMYWSKCNQQSNLLTIMISKNGTKFGGYSTCFINRALGNCDQDTKMKSFLFQYNQKEIYKLKNQAQGVCCCANYGPSYRGGNVFSMNSDLNSGSSKLGHIQDISGYNIIHTATHFFGAIIPQLEEIKVYKVIF